MSGSGIQIPLLITSAVKPIDGVFSLAIDDPNVRLEQTFCSLVSWFKHSNLSKIVICDNTVQPAVFDPLQHLAELSGIDFEAIYCNPSTVLISEYGKGYGEGEIISTALRKSRLLKDTESFYKITGRQFIENFDTIHMMHREIPQLFRGIPGTQCIDTRFYKCSTAYYKEKLINCYKRVRDKEYIVVEQLFMKAMEGDFDGDTFNVEPVVVGYSGSNGELHDKDYDSNIITLAQDLAAKVSL